MSSLETPVDLTKDDDSVVQPTKDDDVVFIQTDSFKFFWEAKPATLERARKSWKSNRLYIPAATRKAKKEMVAGIVEEMNNPSEPIYGKGVPVVVEARFYMPRPNYDFKGNKRGFWYQLKKNVPCCRPHTPDIDNLLKFALDVMNGLVYADDRQVVKAVAYKLLDDSGTCQGRTELEVWPFDGRIHMPPHDSRDHW